MSSGMNTEQAKEYAKTMTYSQAVSNIKHGKGIKYRKATMIKLRELAEIADRFDSKTENSSEIPNNCEGEPQTPYDNCQSCLHWVYDGYWYCECNECRYEPKDEPTISILEQVDKPQISPSDCKTCKNNPWSTPRTCGKCSRQEDGKPSMYEPQTEEWYTYQDEQDYNDRWKE